MAQLNEWRSFRILDALWKKSPRICKDVAVVNQRASIERYAYLWAQERARRWVQLLLHKIKDCIQMNWIVDLQRRNEGQRWFHYDLTRFVELSYVFQKRFCYTCCTAMRKHGWPTITSRFMRQFRTKVFIWNTKPKLFSNVMLNRSNKVQRLF